MEIRWTTKASDDLLDILYSIDKKVSRIEARKFSTQVNSAIEVIDYNPKAGLKESQFEDLSEHDIRWVIVNKYCKLFYTELPEAILILALQKCDTPIDIKRRVRDK